MRFAKLTSETDVEALFRAGPSPFTQRLDHRIDVLAARASDARRNAVDQARTHDQMFQSKPEVTERLHVIYESFDDHVKMAILAIWDHRKSLAIGRNKTRVGLTDLLAQTPGINEPLITALETQLGVSRPNLQNMKMREIWLEAATDRVLIKAFPTSKEKDSPTVLPELQANARASLTNLTEVVRLESDFARTIELPSL